MTAIRCSYLFRDKTQCRESVEDDSEYCFWHDPTKDKKGHDIKRKLEEKQKNGESLEGFFLKGADLEDVHLMMVNLHKVNLWRANLRHAHLFGADLSQTCLFKANLDHANLKQANLEDAELLGAFFGHADLENIQIGRDHKVKNELEADSLQRQGKKKEAKEKYLEAEEIYRNLKSNFKRRGQSFDGGHYFYREMIMKRRQMPLFSVERFWSYNMDFVTGYGEKPYKIIGFSVFYIVLCALIFSLLGIHHSSGFFSQVSTAYSLSENLTVLYDALYFSVVTFTTLGYGDFMPVGIGKLIATVEAFSGAFLTALFTITMYKWYMER